MNLPAFEFSFTAYPYSIYIEVDDNGHILEIVVAIQESNDRFIETAYW